MTLMRRIQGMKVSSGIGYDIHRLVSGRRLVVGGVEIPHHKGLSGHSDADVLIHAICDALLGAIGAGDMGQHFPESDPAYQDISSLILLEAVREKIVSNGYRIMHLDSVIIAEEPRFSPYVAQMRSTIAKALKLKEDSVNIKATTNEKLGSLGRGEGIAAQVVTTLIKEA